MILSELLGTKDREQLDVSKLTIAPITLWEWVGVAGLLLFSTVLRLRPYLDQRAMWLDELFLIENLRERDWMGLLLPLEEGQVTTPAFMILTEFLVNVLGPEEWVYRLIPFLVGIFIPLVAWWVLRKGMGPLVALVIMALCVLNPYLIYYSAEFKHYGLDVLFAFLMLGVAWRIAQDYSYRWMSVFLAVGVLGIALSLTSVFGIASAGLIIGSVLLWHRQWLNLWIWCAMMVLLAALFMVQYELVISQYESDEHVWKFWVEQNGFPAGSPWAFLQGPGDLEHYAWWLWWPQVVFEWIKCPLGIIDTWGMPMKIFKVVELRWIIMPLWLWGVWCLWKQSRLCWSLSMGPVILVLLGAVAWKYPAVERVVLFLLPGMVLPMASLALWLWQSLSRLRFPALEEAPKLGLRLWYVMLGLSLVWCFQFFFSAVTEKRFFEPREISQSEEVPDLMRQLKAVRQPGEPIFIFWWAQYAWREYADKIGMPNYEHPEVTQLVCANEDFEKILWHLQLEAPRDRRFWVVFTHCNSYWPKNERLYIEEAIQKIGGHTIHSDSIRDIREYGDHQTAILALDFSGVPMPTPEEAQSLRDRIWADPDPKDKGLEKHLKHEGDDHEDG